MNHFQSIYDKLESVVLHKDGDINSNEYKIMLNNKIDSSVILKILTGLKNGTLDPNTVLREVLYNLQFDEHLLLIALCIRNSANVNTYVPIQNGNFHILTYVYTLIHDEALRNTLIVMLKLSGSNPNMNYVSDSSESSGGSSGSVIDYLNELKIDHILSLDNDYIISEWDPKSLIKVFTFLDTTKFVNTTNFVNFNLVEIVRDHSINTFKNVYHNIQLKGIVDLCLKYYNIEIFEFCLKLGIPIVYHKVNILCLGIKLSSELIKEVYTEMLTSYFRYGGKLDKYQSNLIPIIPSDTKLEEDIILSNLKWLQENSIEKMSTIDVYKMKQYIEFGAPYLKDPRITGGTGGTAGGKNYIDIFDTKKGVYITTDNFENALSTGGSGGPGRLEENQIKVLVTQRSLNKRLGYPVNKNLLINGSACGTRGYLDEEYFIKIEKAFSSIVSINYNINVDDTPISKMEEVLKEIGIDTCLFNLLSINHFKRTYIVSSYENIEKFLTLYLKATEGTEGYKVKN
jgi:hypothetical protein